MKNAFKKVLLASTLITVGLFASFTTAGLIDRGNGLIYDDVLDVTWMQNANVTRDAMRWNDANTWASNLVFEGFDDWRLPQVYDIGDDGCNYAFGGTDCGYNVATSYTDVNGDTYFSELAYMFHENLGNVSYWTPHGTAPQPGWSSSSIKTKFTDAETGEIVSFQNLGRTNYWSGTEYAKDESRAWYFNTSHGRQQDYSKGAFMYAWALRDGDVADIAEPSNIAIISLVLFGIAYWHRNKVLL